MVTDVLPRNYIHCMTEDLNLGLLNSGQMLYTRVIKCADTEKSVSDTNLKLGTFADILTKCSSGNIAKSLPTPVGIQQRTKEQTEKPIVFSHHLGRWNDGSSTVEFRGLMFHAVSDSRHSCVMMFFVERVRNKSTEELRSSWDSKTSSFDSWDVFHSYGICWNAGENVWKYVIKCL